ncbi:hypothetical protein N7532_011264 [Penicillium argentinense]|uniref:Zn(2)-C6 fungal-type domain-containing protein n=1 Tax=Penicillium argentinense TaxID=1131581 RepID=A0A9W9EI37_9EURO|nr:uncharacterized protein N7532_011264 [Penicillium argentinense]KAJ5082221.1 hypothetical protein N7532_011264 [Penicillium argentinense]
MPSRRSHTKSRKGCLECKRRHVKCDEELPKCTLCKKRKLECSYPPSQSDLDSSHGSPSARDGSETGPRTPGDLPMPARMLEMRLMHHYLMSTYHTLAQDGLSAHHLSMSIPQMATSFPYLLDSLLAMTALHLASLEAENRMTWLDTAVRYQSQACAGLGKILPEISLQHYEPAFVSSVFIMLFAIGFHATSADNGPGDPLSPVLEVRTLLSGAAMLFNRFNEVGSDGELSGWLCIPETEERLKASKQDGDGVSDDNTEKLLNLHKDIMVSIEKLKKTIDSEQRVHQAVYKTTWELLNHAIQPWPKIGAQGGIIAWPLFITDQLLSLLQEGDWLARILFMHWGVAMRLLYNRWYVRDWGRQLVLATLEPMKEPPPKWIEEVAWIKRAAEIKD